MSNIAGRNEFGNQYLHAALRYGARSFHVFPTKSGTKDEPLIKWRLFSSSDPRAIRQWWGKWPDANIGIDTGKSGLLVLDADSKPDKNGYETILDWDINGLVLPPTLKARTRSGGTHYVFKNRWPNPFRTTASMLGAGLDTRGHGGYIVAAPSLVGNGTYAWLNDLAPADLPPWLVEKLEVINQRRPAVDPVEQNAVIELDQQHNIDWAIDWLTNDAPISIEGEGVELNALRVAAICKDMGLSREQTEELMFDRWNARCLPPWSHSAEEGCAIADALDIKIRNAFAYCRIRRPGCETAEYEFGSDPDDGEWLPFEGHQPRIRKVRRTLIAGEYIDTGRRKKGVRVLRGIRK